MTFSSWSFLFFFLLLCVVYGVSGRFFKKVVLNKILLLLASLIFYAWAGVKNLPFLFFSLFSSYFAGMFIEQKKSVSVRKVVLVLAIVLNLLMLVVFKYTNFLISTVNAIFSQDAGFAPVSFILPLGISFYVFQVISYLIDVSRETVKAERNFLDYSLYVLYFPQIIQGPIERYSDLSPQFNNIAVFDYCRITAGLKRIAWGLFKKLYIADFFGLYVNEVYGDVSKSSGIALLIATVFYAVQIYADFSGYMDVAIGSSQILGIKISENFNHPYFSKTISEFWRRWHITLGAWFKDYLFYPVFRKCNDTFGKKIRKSGHKNISKILPQIFSLLVVWFATGLWHGANWTFVFWGLWHGLFIILESLSEKKVVLFKSKLGISSDSKCYGAFQVAKTFIIVCIGYIFFRASSCTDVVIVIKKVLMAGSDIKEIISSLHSMGGVAEAKEVVRDILMLDSFRYKNFAKALFLVFAGFLISFMTQKKSGIELVSSKGIVIRWSLYTILILLTFSALIDINSGLHTSFIYNQF